MEFKRVGTDKRIKCYVDNIEVSEKDYYKIMQDYYSNQKIQDVFQNGGILSNNIINKIWEYSNTPNTLCIFGSKDGDKIQDIIDSLKSMQIFDDLDASPQNDTEIDISLPKDEGADKLLAMTNDDELKWVKPNNLSTEEFIVRNNHINGFTIQEVFELIRSGEINEALIQNIDGKKRWIFNTGLEVLDEEIENREVYMDIFYKRYEIIEFDDITVPSFDEFYSKSETIKLSKKEEKELAESSKLTPFSIEDIKQRNENDGYYLHEIMTLRNHCDYLIIEGDDGIAREVFEDGLELVHKEGETCTLKFNTINQKYAILEINDISLYKEDVEAEPQNPYYQEAKFNEVAKKLKDFDTPKIMGINPENENDYVKFNRGDFMNPYHDFSIDAFLSTIQPYLTWNWHYKVN